MDRGGVSAVLAALLAASSEALRANPTSRGSMLVRARLRLPFRGDGDLDSSVVLDLACHMAAALRTEFPSELTELTKFPSEPTSMLVGAAVSRAFASVSPDPVDSIDFFLGLVALRMSTSVSLCRNRPLLLRLPNAAPTSRGLMLERERGTALAGDLVGDLLTGVDAPSTLEALLPAASLREPGVVCGVLVALRDSGGLSALGLARVIDGDIASLGSIPRLPRRLFADERGGSAFSCEKRAILALRRPGLFFGVVAWRTLDRAASVTTTSSTTTVPVSLCLNRFLLRLLSAAPTSRGLILDCDRWLLKHERGSSSGSSDARQFVAQHTPRRRAGQDATHVDLASAAWPGRYHFGRHRAYVRHRCATYNALGRTGTSSSSDACRLSD